MQQTNDKFDSDPTGMGKIITESAERRKRYLMSLKGVPYEHRAILAKDFQNLQEVEAFLEAVRVWYDGEVAELESIYGKEGSKDKKAFIQEKQRLEDAAFNKALGTVDKLNIWRYKFSTMSGAGIDDPLICSPDDSIYFMTHYGVSLRFKRANRGKGIREIVLPFMERISFLQGNDLIEMPRKGYYVREYATQEFLALVDWKQPVEKIYLSRIRKYKRNNGEIEIPRLNDSLYIHNGDPVNWIEER